MKPLVLFFILTSTVVAEEFPPLFTEEQWNNAPGVCSHVLIQSLPQLFPEGECPPHELWTFIEDLPFVTNKNIYARQISSKGSMLIWTLYHSEWKHLEAFQHCAVFCGFCVTNEVESLGYEPQLQSIIGASPEQVRQFERERNYLAEKSIRDACASVRRITIYNLTNAIPASIVSQYPPDVLLSNLQEIAISAKLSEEETAQMYRSLHLTPPAQEEGGNAGEEEAND
jgi:hypothetical protein